MKKTLAKSVLALGISILFTVFIAYSYTVVYERPTGNKVVNNCYQEFACEKKCNDESIRSDHTAYQDCILERSTTTEYAVCKQMRADCQAEWTRQTSDYIYSRNSFYILGAISIITIIIGILIIQLEGIGSGFILGGVFLFIWTLASTSKYWMDFNKVAKVFTLGIALVVLVYFGYKMIEKNKKE